MEDGGVKGRSNDINDKEELPKIRLPYQRRSLTHIDRKKESKRRKCRGKVKEE